MKEVWKAISGYSGAYEVSNLGRVKSLERQCSRLVKGVWMFRTVPEIILKPLIWGRYPMVRLCDGVNIEKRRVHELVLTTFIGRRPFNKVACHYDGDALNNSLSNLRWDTPSNNEFDKVRHGTDTRGSRNGNSKLTDEQVIQIYLSTKPQQEISEEFGVSKVWISSIKNRKRWKHLTEELPDMGRDKRKAEHLTEEL